MKFYTWNSDKNETFKRDRNISFEEILYHIKLGKEVDIFDHPNQEKYPGQKISAVVVNNYVYLVPYVENDKNIFLKTIIPSRKATKKYLGDKDD